jgi:hypothetical protein
VSLYAGNHEIKVGGDYQVGKTTAISNISGLQQVSKFNEYGQLYYAHTLWATSPTDFTPVNNLVSPKTYNQSAFVGSSAGLIAPTRRVPRGDRRNRVGLRQPEGHRREAFPCSGFAERRPLSEFPQQA